MILVDTSAWIEFFRRQGDPAVKERVAVCIERDEAAYTCPIYFELLAGAGAKEQETVDMTLELCTRYLFRPEDWARAAAMEKDLRSHGITVPRDDVFVAVVAEERGLPILCKDRHFDMIRSAGHPALHVQQFA
jgi:predicted nucleic acid-binding protein